MQVSQVIFFFCVVCVHGVLSEERVTCELSPIPMNNTKSRKIQGDEVVRDKKKEIAGNTLFWNDMVDPCIKIMRDQVQIELTAAMTYMSMGAHFARDTVNRPGFSKMFFESASEERDHAIKIISYLLMRGELVNGIINLIKDPKPEAIVLGSGEEALKAALGLEAKVTNKVREIIKLCEDGKENEEATNFNDYHLVDYLTGVFLEEQYNGQRDLAGKIQTLGKMMKTHGALGEFLFDKKLLNGTPL